MLLLPSANRLKVLHREIVLLLALAALAAGAFAATRAVAAGNRQMRLADAAGWHEQGLEHLAAGRVDAAAGALRRAAGGDPENRIYRLSLARALLAGGQVDAARGTLLNLHGRYSEDPEPAVQLARLEAAHGDLPTAVRFYQIAIGTLWPAAATDARRQLRLELIEFLLERDQRSRALAELLVLAADLPAEPGWQTRAGQLFLKAGDPRRALDWFALVLDRTPAEPAALAGAGQAAFALGDYARALRFLERAPDTDTVVGLRTTARFVMARDPLAPRLGAEERRRRLAHNLEDAMTSLAVCARSDIPAASSAFEPFQREVGAYMERLTPRALGVRDLIEGGVELVHRIERTVQQSCGIRPLDRALLLIARRHGLDGS